MKKLMRRARYLLEHQRFEQELGEELEFHKAMVERDLAGSGAGKSEARRAMGNVTLACEDARAVWIWPWLDSVRQDLTYAFRTLRRQPGFTAAAVLALALGIGLNTSLFTVFNAVALRPWPVHDPSRVVKIYGWLKNPPRGFDNARGFPVAEYEFLAGRTHTMSGLIATRGEGGLHLDDGKARAEYVSANYFSLLGVRMAAGRGFLPEEGRVGAPQAVLVLSNAAWQSRYGADPAIVGRRIRLEDIPFTIVGVAPPDFGGTSPERTDLWLPLSANPLINTDEKWAVEFLTKPTACCADLAGRLAPGVTRDQAQAELSLLSQDFHRELHEPSDGVRIVGTPILQRPGGKAGKIYAVFGLMFAAVLLVLLLACANVGNLLLARAAARRREIGARLALGAGRLRIVRQLLTESLALASLAAIAGVGLANVLPGPLFRSAVGEVSLNLTPDPTVLAFTAIVAVLSCIAFGLAPALHATGGSLSDALRVHHTAAGRRLSLRSVLLAVQVAVSTILLVGAGLLVRGIQHTRMHDPGFAVTGIACITLELPSTLYRAGGANSFFQNLHREARDLTAAQPLGWTDLEPLGGTRSYTGFSLADGHQGIPVLSNSVSPGYFEVLRIPILAGRNFTANDTGKEVVLVNQAMADRFFPGTNALGQKIYSGGPHQIAGIVSNARTWGLDENEPAVFFPASDSAQNRLVVRNTPANLGAIQSIVRSLDRRVHVQVTPIEDSLDRWLSTYRLGAAVAGMLGLLALALASIGIAGVFAYAVQQRTREIGIRMALGARPAQVVASVAGSAVWPLITGLSVGLAAAMAASRLIRQYLFGLNRLDPVTYALVLLTLALAAIAAAYFPARRAARLNPIRALHWD